MNIRNKKGAMEMSVGTIVTIVLLMTVLIMGLVLVRNIFSSSVENIDSIDTAVKSEINKLFSEDSEKRIVVYPPSRTIKIQKGEDSQGFGFAIRNINTDAMRFSYEITASEVSCASSMRLTEAENLIILGRTGTNILIPAGTVMEYPVFVKYNIPETAPPCIVRYIIQLYSEGRVPYSSPISLDLEIESK